MSILDTFLIVFKADTSDLKKGTQEADKLQKNLQEQVKKTDKETENLGKQFVKMVEQTAIAFGGIITLGGQIKALGEIAKSNSALNVQSKIIGQNTQDMEAYGAAVEAAGGNMQAFLGYMQDATQKAADAGLKLPPITQFFREIRKELEGLSDNEKLRRLNLLGITDPGMVSLLEETNDEFERHIALAQQVAQASKGDTQAARDFEEALSKEKESLKSFGTAVSAYLLPIATKVLNILNGTTLFNYLNNAEVPKGSPAPSGLKPSLSGARQSGSSKSSYDFWIAQGYSPSQAAALVANEQRESNFNPGAVGDNGQALGIMQWHPDRRKNILDATGIDIATASHDDQLKAAAWELQNMGVAGVLKGASSTAQAADILTRRFEMPANQNAESLIRGMLADNIYHQMMMSNIDGINGLGGSTTINSGGNKNINVKVDNIMVQTQATDANGIAAGISSGLQTHFRDLVSTVDDGVQK